MMPPKGQSGVKTTLTAFDVKEILRLALQVLRKFLAAPSVINDSGFFIRNRAFRYTFTQKGDPDGHN
jgi:hypothetical protein